MADRSGIEHRYSCLSLNADWKTRSGAGYREENLYRKGNFANTATRMRLYEEFAPVLAQTAVERLDIAPQHNEITHLVITSCTGFFAPGLDWEIVERCGLNGSVERTVIGFMGCAAAINGLKAANHIVRSEPGARVLVVNLELSTLHFQETTNLPQLLCFMLFADGAAASLITSESVGIGIDRFRAALVPDQQKSDGLEYPRSPSASI